MNFDNLKKMQIGYRGLNVEGKNIGRIKKLPGESHQAASKTYYLFLKNETTI